MAAMPGVAQSFGAGSRAPPRSPPPQFRPGGAAPGTAVTQRKYAAIADARPKAIQITVHPPEAEDHLEREFADRAGSWAPRRMTRRDGRHSTSRPPAPTPLPGTVGESDV